MIIICLKSILWIAKMDRSIFSICDMDYTNGQIHKYNPCHKFKKWTDLSIEFVICGTEGLINCVANKNCATICICGFFYKFCTDSRTIQLHLQIEPVSRGKNGLSVVRIQRWIGRPHLLTIRIPRK